VILNFTLQFISPENKAAIVDRIFSGLNPGGALILSEKVICESAQEQERVESLYFDFKRHNGYNDLEISQKRDALENVLKLDTRPRHVDRLRSAGFSVVDEWFHCLNFASFLAVK